MNFSIQSNLSAKIPDMNMKDPLIQNMQKPLDEISDDATIVKYLCNMIGEAEEAQSDNISVARRNWHFVLGNHFIEEGLNNDWVIDESNPYWRTRLQRDVLTPVVRTQTAILHKLRPELMVEADFPGENVFLYHQNQHIELPVNNALAAGRLQRIIESEWDSRNEEILQAELLLDVIVQGNAWRTYMPVQKGNSWHIMPKLLDISQVLPDPDGSDLTNFEDFKYIIICEMMDVADIERIYHVKESSFARGPGKNENTPAEFLGGDTGLYREYGWEHSNQRGVVERYTKRQRRKYPVYTIYYHQGCPDVFSYGKKPPKELKFPLGRQMTLINKKKLVNDIHNPYWHKKFPMTCYQKMPIPHKNFGMSDITRLIPVQEMVNILQNMILANAIILGVPQWIVEDGMIEDAEITNEPGAIIHARQGALSSGAFQRLDPRQSGDDLYSNLRDLEVHAQEDLGNMSDAIQGKAVTSNASGVLQNSALGAALTVEGFAAQMLDAGHNRSAGIETSMVQQYLHTDTQMLMETRESGELLEMNLAIRELFYDVKTESQAELPHNPQARLNWATHQLQMGFFDAEEYRLFTGMKVRPELEKMLQEASKFFMPLVPLELQAQVRFEHEIARLREKLAEAGVDPSGGPEQQQMSGGQQNAMPAPAGRSGEEITGTGPNANSGPAGSPNQRPL